MSRDTGTTYWRSLNELQGTPQFEEMLHREFPEAASELPDGISRRRWLQLMGASLALGGVGGCRWEAEQFAPFAVRPTNRTPGIPQRFATSHEVGGSGRGLLVTCYDGRPTKVEGNPDHPLSEGGTDVFDQAAILNLYDPDRSDAVIEQSAGQRFTRDWSDFDRFASRHFAALKRGNGKGLFLLSEATSSPTYQRLLEELQKNHPEAVCLEYESFSRDHERSGAQLAFGRVLRPHYDFDRARVVACLDADPLGMHPAATRHVRDWAAHRDPDSGSFFNRVYSVESELSVTGAQADHRLPIQSSSIRLVTAVLESLILQRLGDSPRETSRRDPGDNSDPRLASRLPLSPEEILAPGQLRFVEALVNDLVETRGGSLLMAGPTQPADVHARVHRINEWLGNSGATVRYTAEPDAGRLSHRAAIDFLSAELREGNVDTLIMLGGNPVYDAPVEVQFGDALQKAKTSIHLSAYRDETSELCTWHLPLAHAFEVWGDTRSNEGTYSISQPLIEPLLTGRSGIQLLAAFNTGNPPASGDLGKRFIQETFYSVLPESPGRAWDTTLHDGFLAGSAFESVNVTVSSSLQSTLDAISLTPPQRSLEVVFSPSRSVYDGRFSNNAWLQELPEPLSKLTWDNAALLSPTTAREHDIEHGDVVRIGSDGRSVEAPVYILPGQAENSIGLQLGYGRTAAGTVAGHVAHNIDPVGVNVSTLRSIEHIHFENGVTITSTGRRHEFATTQEHFAIDRVGLEEISGRVGDLVREGTVDEYAEHPDFAHHGHEEIALWEQPEQDGPQWGMSIDLSKCIGCNACVVACQSENNIPVVGKEQVLKGREMHWLRLDRYFTGDMDEPEVVQQPVACQHCENAPCEQVCPVAATVHSDDGLNDMVYNRCIGTRYCANNCPYKVRRFNFFDYQLPVVQPEQSLKQLAFNPEVTVRSRGVMEKCTYCVQRIRNISILADNDRRPLEDGEVQTACQQSCPAQAITFGDLKLSGSEVATEQSKPRAYGMLDELNVKPRTKYLARIRNPNPVLKATT
ncbi:MAG: TAT-variant-translocated molybdopterin oxidoreductase [Planctomycetaceae bacterium]|jgi:MoCo/4Fe-4S cofactor protein with predicted Tat translocation signal|nr:TAT-variant-translocated molybdopterin oxidoreductase [Planctomycetaceae bacterium]